MEELKKHKKDMLIKEYELMIPLLSQHIKAEFQIRSWFVTLWVVVFGSSLKLEVNSALALLLSMILWLVFYGLSLSQIYFQSRTSDRIIKVQELINNFMNLSDNEIRTIVTPLIIRNSSLKEAGKKTFEGMKHKNFFTFYSAMFIVTLITYLYLLPNLTK